MNAVYGTHIRWDDNFLCLPPKGRRHIVFGGAWSVRPVPSVRPSVPSHLVWAYPTCSFLSMHAINLRLGRDRGHIKYMRLLGCDLGFDLWPWPCDPHKHIFGSFLAPKWCFLDLGLQLWTDRKPYVNFLFQLWTLTQHDLERSQSQMRSLRFQSALTH